MGSGFTASARQSELVDTPTEADSRGRPAVRRRADPPPAPTSPRRKGKRCSVLILVPTLVLVLVCWLGCHRGRLGRGLPRSASAGRRRRGSRQRRCQRPVRPQLSINQDGSQWDPTVARRVADALGRRPGSVGRLDRRPRRRRSRVGRCACRSPAMSSDLRPGHPRRAPRHHGAGESDGDCSWRPGHRGPATGRLLLTRDGRHQGRPPSPGRRQSVALMGASEQLAVMTRR